MSSTVAIHYNGGVKWLRGSIPLLLTIAIGAPIGCGDDATRPADGGGGEPTPPFYPLEVGNEWSYEETFVVHFYNADSGALLDADTLVGISDVRLDGTESIAGITYVTESTVFRAGVGADTTWLRLRQDAEGLFRAYVPSSVPPGDVQASEPPLELMRLRYPVATGAEWTVFSDSPTVTATVEALDTLMTAGGSFAAYRIRIDASYQRPDDWQRVWYGWCGRIRSVRHTEVIAIDPGTDERVRVVTEETEMLTHASLVEPRDCVSEGLREQ